MTLPSPATARPRWPAAVQLDAAQQLMAVQTRYALRGVGMAQAALAGARHLDTLRHYPARDVIDAGGAGQFYYHAHDRALQGDGEHGHFHLFSNRQRGAPARHLVALSLDARGWPLRWFCTNRWVTGGPWTGAAATLTGLRRFRPAARGRLAPVARWLGALVLLYDAELAHLLQRRDQALAQLTRTRPPEDVFEDRSLDLLAVQPLALAQRLQALADAAAP
jgi:hypothetical protein